MLLKFVVIKCKQIGPTAFVLLGTERLRAKRIRNVENCDTDCAAGLRDANLFAISRDHLWSANFFKVHCITICV